MFDKNIMVGKTEDNKKTKQEIKNAERYICVILLVIICVLMYNYSKLNNKVKQYKITNTNINENISN